MVETADLSDVSSFLQGITGDITSAYKTFNAPTSTPAVGAAVPGRPGFVYGPGGSIQAVNPATGGVLPPVNSVLGTGTSLSTILLGLGLAFLAGAFFLSVRGRR